MSEKKEQTVKVTYTKKKKIIGESLQAEIKKIQNIDDIFALVKKIAHARFDESIDCAIRITPKKKKTDKNIRGSLSLSSSVLKEKPKIAVFATGEDVEKAKKAGAAHAGLEDLIEEITSGKIQYKYYVCSKNVFGQIAKVARFLKGLMPNAKLGTVTEDVTSTCQRLISGIVEYREDKAGIIHAKFAYKSFTNEAIKNNFIEFLTHIYNNYNNGRSPAEFFKSVYIKSTQGSPIPVNAGILASAIGK